MKLKRYGYRTRPNPLPRTNPLSGSYAVFWRAGKWSDDASAEGFFECSGLTEAYARAREVTNTSTSVYIRSDRKAVVREA